MISFASMGDLEDLRQIWRECFHDEDSYINFFFSNHKVDEVTLVYRQEGHVVGMLNLLPGHMFVGNKNIPIRYIYAVATLPKYQGLGIAGKLLKEANQILNSQGVATVLVPASKDLFRYYERQGYQTAFHMNEYEYRITNEDSMVTAASIQSKDKLKNLALCEISSLKYKEIRDRHFQGSGYVNWGISEITYAIKENAFLGGETRKVQLNHQEEIIMYYVNENTLVVKETTLNKEILVPVLSEIATRLNCNSFKIRSSKSSIMEGTLRPFGMIYGLPDKSLQSGYLNLVLD